MVWRLWRGLARHHAQPPPIGTDGTPIGCRKAPTYESSQVVLIAMNPVVGHRPHQFGLPGE